MSLSVSPRIEMNRDLKDTDRTQLEPVVDQMWTLFGLVLINTYIFVFLNILQHYSVTSYSNDIPSFAPQISVPLPETMVVDKSYIAPSR